MFDNVILVYLCRFECLAHLNVIPNADVGLMQDELTEILAKRHIIDRYEIKTDAKFIFIYPLGKSDPEWLVINAWRCFQKIWSRKHTNNNFHTNH